MPNFKYNLILVMEDSNRCIEIREYLRDLGYKISHDTSDGVESHDCEPYELIYTTNGVVTCDFLSAEEICEYVGEGYILCHNIDEFKTIAAINDENDYNQLFKFNDGSMYLCKYMSQYKMWGEQYTLGYTRSKASLEEIIQYFNK